MGLTLTVRDERLYGQQTEASALTLDFLTAQITVRELIRERVYQEVKDYNLQQPEYYRDLVQPSDAEQTLNGGKLHQRRSINWEEQFAKALTAFMGNGFIILVNDQQVDDLETLIEVQASTTVTFLKLVPLVGG